MGTSKEYVIGIHNTITDLWKYMKTFLLRPVDETYWQDLYDQSYHGKDEFTARMYTAAIKEIERIKK